MGTGMPPIPAGLGSHPSLSHQIPLVNLAATPAQQLCKVQQELVKATCPEHPGLCSSLQKPFLGSVGSSSRSSGEGNLPIQLTALTLLLLIPAASRWCWGLCECLTATWSCGYQHGCNPGLGRNVQSMRNSEFLLPSSSRSLLSPCLCPASPSSPGHKLPAWPTSIAGAQPCSGEVAISPGMPGISPFMQHTFAGSRFDGGISSFSRGVFPHTCWLFEQPKPPPSTQGR